MLGSTVETVSEGRTVGSVLVVLTGSGVVVLTGVFAASTMFFFGSGRLAAGWAGFSPFGG